MNRPGSDFSPNEPNPDERDRLEQELLELHFGCHEDPAALEARLAKEPALRALQQQVIARARLLEAAARPAFDRIDLPIAAAPTPAPAVRRWRLLRTSTGRLLAATMVAAATVLGFFLFEQSLASRFDAFQREHLHLTVSAPSAVPAGAPWSLTVQALDLSGKPVNARVRWRSLGEQDAVLAAGEIPVENGVQTVPMVAGMRIPRRVEVIASNSTDEVRQVLDLGSVSATPLVHVTSDRPVYLPGDTAFARAVVLDRVTLLPNPVSGLAIARLLDAKGALVAERRDEVRSGAASFSFAIPEGSAGGTHHIEVSSSANAFAPESLEVVVRPFQRPQLRKTIVLDRMSYAPGAHGSAEVSVERMGGGVAAGAAVKAALVLDGDEVWSDTQVLAPTGKLRFSFTVPKDVKQGAARFVATVTDGGIVEAEVKPFVIPTGKVLVEGFPEGGELVAGVANGLYLECTDPLGRAVDTSGALVDDRGDVVTKFRTVHQGRVKLTFVPEHARSYSIAIPGQPLVALRPVQAQGISLQLRGDEVAADAPVRLRVAGRGNGPWVLGIFCRGALVGQTTLRANERGELHTDAEVVLPTETAGVLRATVFDREQRPVAERLLRRALAHRVQIDIECGKATLLPGESQSLLVHTRDERGAPIPAIIGLGVTDLAVTSLGSEPRLGLFDFASLFADVERVENLGDFLAGTAEAPRNADLLLGTRGWRRFVWRNDDAAKAAIKASGPWAKNMLERERLTQDPQVASNLAAAAAPGQPLQAAADIAHEHVGEAIEWCLIGLLALAIVETLAKLAFASRRAPHLWPALVLTATALLLFLVSRPNTLGTSAPLDDFRNQRQRWDRLVEDTERAMPKAPPGIDVFNLGMPARLAGGRDDNILVFYKRFANDELAFPGPNLRLDVPGDDSPLFPEREYAHSHTSVDDRRDFAPTIFWNGALATDASGSAKVEFQTSDAVTTWLVQVDAHAAPCQIGRVGQGEARFRTTQPFHLEAKLPDEISLGDTLDLPIAAIVEGVPLTTVDLRVACSAGLQLRGEVPTHIDLQNGRGRVLLPIAVDGSEPNVVLTLEGHVGRFGDRVQHTLHVAPRGFPHRRSAGGTVGAEHPAALAIAIPADAVPGSGRAVVKLFPSPLTALTEGLQGILQEPCGCFEQASSSNYPNTLVLTLLDATGNDIPAVAARAHELLPRGYQKITSYECKERGYEWFGGDPGHEALTAYGLLQFHDMTKVCDVDAAMIERTKAWLLARRDGKGGYLRNSRALDQFGGAPQPITDAYVTYALLQAGVPAATLQAELDALVARISTNDPYELALIGCALQIAGRAQAAKARERLTAMQHEDGSLNGTTTSITHSGGRDLTVETTGFAVLAWLPDPACHAQMLRAVQFLQSQRTASGTFGATQATITALRALTAYAQAHRTMRQAGTLRVFEGEIMLAERAFAAGTVDAISVDLWSKLAPGVHSLRLELEGGGGDLPWASDLCYSAEQPADDPDGKVAVHTSLRAAKVAEGDTVALDVEVENRTADGQPMAMAIIGLPAGLELPTRVLDDLQKQQTFALWELRGRELALYWRDLAPEQKHRLTLDLIARIPGRSTGPASRSYLYYTPQGKRWAAPSSVEVTAR